MHNRIPRIIIAAALIAVGLAACQTEKVDDSVILQARLDDDLSHLFLTVHENGDCSIRMETWASKDEFDGRCKLDGDQLLFLERPYDNDFIPDTAVIIGDSIALRTTESGEPDFSFANFFVVTHRRP